MGEYIYIYIFNCKKNHFLHQAAISVDFIKPKENVRFYTFFFPIHFFMGSTEQMQKNVKLLVLFYFGLKHVSIRGLCGKQSKLGALLQTQMLLMVSSLCGVFTFTLVFQSISNALSFACRCGREKWDYLYPPYTSGIHFLRRAFPST